MTKLSIGVEGFREFGANPEVEKPKIISKIIMALIMIAIMLFIFGYGILKIMAEGLH